jgi:transposase-like protein
MELHGSAALTRRQRRRLVTLVGEGVTISAAALIVGCSRQTASKWVGRARRGEGLEDRSSRPKRSPRRTPAAVEQAVLRARRELRAGPHPLGWALELAASTVHAMLVRHGCSQLNPRERAAVVRYERERPGELLHVDVKKLGTPSRTMMSVRVLCEEAARACVSARLSARPPRPTRRRPSPPR